MVLIGTGSEVQLAVEARTQLAEQGVRARVVSMPCREWFDEQDAAYRETVIPPTGSRRGLRRGWRRQAGVRSSATTAGSSGSSTMVPQADFARIYQEFGITGGGRRGRRARDNPETK